MGSSARTSPSTTTGTDQPKSSFGYNSYVSAASYTSFGEPAQYTLGNLGNTAWLTYDYDEHTHALNGVNLSAQQAWSQIDDLRYNRDPAGNITKIVNTQGSVANGAPTRTQCFDYDALNRLTQAWTATDNCAGDPSAATVGGVNPYRTSWDINEIGLRDTETLHTATPSAQATASGPTTAASSTSLTTPSQASPTSAPASTTPPPVGSVKRAV